MSKQLNGKIFEEIHACRLCSSTQLQDVLDLGSQPPANSLRKNLSEELPTAPLNLVHCADCSAVQLTATVDPSYLFSQYVWVTGTSATAKSYSEFFCREVLKRSNAKSPFVVEVASNDGTFLKQFKKQGCEILGVDPAKNIAEAASQDGIPTWANFFTESIANKILAEKSAPQIVMARNVIPHVKEIHSIIKGMSQLSGKDGMAVIEFHYAKKIVDELHYDSIYHEHLFFFSLKSLSKLAEQYGLYPFDVFESPISGGSLVLFFSTQKKAPSPDLQKKLDEEKKCGLNDLETWKKFGVDSIQHAKDLKKIVGEYARNGKLIGYGASARSSTMLNFAGISDEQIECVIDKAPLKQGLYTPGTNIKIVNYEAGIQAAKGKHILLLAWNFEEEIVRDLRASGFEGDIIVPLPNKIHKR